MIGFLKIVAGIFIGFILFVIAIYFFIKWKFRKAIKGVVDVFKQLGAIPTVPPFRIKLKKYSDVCDDNENNSENREEYDRLIKEFNSLGFEKIEEYYIEEIGTSMTALTLRSEAIYGAVYDHYVAKVWCDIGRRYEDGTTYAYTTCQDTCADEPKAKTLKFFPGEPLKNVFEQFQLEAPKKKAVLVSNEQYAKYYEKIYAQEMNWRIKRGGLTEEEIRRVAERDGTECTSQHIKQVQYAWREAIFNFLSESIVKRYIKDADLTHNQREDFEDEAVVIHRRMEEHDLLSIFDEEYYYHPPMDDLEGNKSDVDKNEQIEWENKLSLIRKGLEINTPQEVFRQMIDNDPKADNWEFKTSVDKPVSADIWIRHYDDDDDNDEYYEDEDESELDLDDD